MHSLKLQGVLGQLADLSPAELSEVKSAVNEALASHLRAIGANGFLTEEEWERLESDSLSRAGISGCVRMVRERTGLNLRDSKDYVDRARTKGKLRVHTLSDDSGAGPQRDDEGHTLGGCDTPDGQDFGNGRRSHGRIIGGKAKNDKARE